MRPDVSQPLLQKRVVDFILWVQLQSGLFVVVQLQSVSVLIVPVVEFEVSLGNSEQVDLVGMWSVKVISFWLVKVVSKEGDMDSKCWFVCCKSIMLVDLSLLFSRVHMRMFRPRPRPKPTPRCKANSSSRGSRLVALNKVLGEIMDLTESCAAFVPGGGCFVVPGSGQTAVRKSTPSVQ